MTAYSGLVNIIEHVVYTYNEHGDQLTATRDGGVHVMHRTIRYYDE